MTKKRKRGKKRPVPLVAPPSISIKKTLLADRQSNNNNNNNTNSNTNSGNTNSKSQQQHLFSNTSESLKLIQEYHTLNKRLEQNARDDNPTLTPQQRKLNADKIRIQQEALGGIHRYQQASMYGAKSSKFVCAHWVEPLLKQHMMTSLEEEGKSASSTSRPRIRILDVGAIDNQYLQYDWFDAVPIDLNAQHESVVQADFFDYAHDHIKAAEGLDGVVGVEVQARKDKDNKKGAKNKSKNEKDKLKDDTSKDKSKPFDAIVLSLVLNFQGDPRKRGDMLALSADARLLKPGGLVYLALPSASLDNSRYCDEDYLIRICHELGLEVVERKRSAKLALVAFQQTLGSGSGGVSDVVSVGSDIRTASSSSSSSSSLGFQAYNVASKTFTYPKEMSRAPAKSGDMRNNFAIMLKN